MISAVSPTIKTLTSGETYARFVVEPLESGFGTTLGNALRRALLSSLPGAAVTWVRIDQVQHEFSSIPHMKEDTTEFLLNVKGIRLRPLSDRPGKLLLEVAGEGEITAADIRPPANFEIVNPELYLATLDSAEGRLTVELNVEHGKGYVPAGQVDGQPIGVIPVDAIFTPMRKVNFVVEHTRIGQITNYDRLIIDIWTDGTIAPTEALSQSAQILMKHLSLFVELTRPTRGGERRGLRPAGLTQEGYDTPIEELGLSIRSYNCLKRQRITTVGQVLEMSEDELLAVPNFGRKSLDELRDKLQSRGFLPPAEGKEKAPAGKRAAAQTAKAGTTAVATQEEEDAASPFKILLGRFPEPEGAPDSPGEKEED